MKLIFLDFDGVLVNRKSLMQASGMHAKADPDCVRELNRILEVTGAKVVVSSTWRHAGLLAVKDFLSEWGVKCQTIGITPRGYGVRGHEIQQFLEQNRRHDVEDFIIIDDDSDMAHLLPRLIKTEFEVGLTADDADKAIATLIGEK